MRLRDAGLFVRARLSRTLRRALNARSAIALPVPLPLEAVVARPDPSPLDLARLLEGRSNVERQLQLQARFTF